MNVELRLGVEDDVQVIKNLWPRVYLDALVVLQSLVRRGLASELVRHVLNAYPSEEFTVSTGALNDPAHRLYAKHGLVEQRRWATDDGIPMRTLRHAGPNDRG